MTPSALVAVAAAALVSSLALQEPIRRWLLRRGVLDRPNDRSLHTIATPRGGGWGVMAGLTLGCVAGISTRGVTGPHVSLGIGTLIAAWAAALVGGLDDARGLSILLRLGVVLAIGLGLGALVVGQQQRHVSSVALLIAMALAVTTMVNAFNFMDGVNGISVTNGSVSAVAYVVVGAVVDAPVVMILGTALAAGLLGFAPWNVLTGRMFLGDVGSYGIGAVLGALAVISWASGARLDLAVAPLALYLADTGWTILRRAARGAPVGQSHREHVYQRWAQSGRSHFFVAVGTALVSSMVVIAVWLGWPAIGPGFWVGHAVALLLLCAYLALPRWWQGDWSD